MLFHNFRIYILCGVFKTWCYVETDIIEPKSQQSLQKFPLGKLDAVHGVTYIDQTDPSATGSLILLHGTTKEGRTLKITIDELLGHNLAYPHIRIIYPTAPTIRYSHFDGLWATTWYDISKIDIDGVENEEDLERVLPDLKEIIQREERSGIDTSRIAVAGISRGGSFAFHVGYTTEKGLACVGAISSFLPKNSSVFKALSSNEKSYNAPLLLQLHGIEDPKVNIILAEWTFNNFQSHGVNGTFIAEPNTTHDITTVEINEIIDFVGKAIPNDK